MSFDGVLLLIRDQDRDRDPETFILEIEIETEISKSHEILEISRLSSVSESYPNIFVPGLFLDVLF